MEKIDFKSNTQSEYESNSPQINSKKYSSEWDKIENISDFLIKLNTSNKNKNLKFLKNSLKI